MTSIDQALAYKLQPYLSSALQLKQQGLISLPSMATAKGMKPPWVDPPAGSQAFQYFQPAALNLGNAGSGVQVVIVFQVPAGRSGVLTQIANQIIGGGMTEATGNMVWQILLDGYPSQGFDNIINTLGNAAIPGDL